MLYFSAVNYIQYVVMLLSQLLELFQGAFTVLGTGYLNRSIHLFDSRYENPWETKQFLWNSVNIFQFWLKMDKKQVFSMCTNAYFSSYFESNLLNADSNKNVSNKSHREEW